jgi:3-(3-hydroxy-phenyl)propionate hydroxylase
MGRMVCTLDVAAAEARDREMIARREAGAPFPPLRAAPFTAGCLLAGSPGAGELFPQPAQGDERLDDVMGEGVWLIVRQPFAAPLGLIVRQLDDPALAPFRAALTTWLEARGVEAVLVRPDRYVFAAGAPEALVEAWATAMRATPVAALQSLDA